MSIMTFQSITQFNESSFLFSPWMFDRTLELTGNKQQQQQKKTNFKRQTIFVIVTSHIKNGIIMKRNEFILYQINMTKCTEIIAKVIHFY